MSRRRPILPDLKRNLQFSTFLIRFLMRHVQNENCGYLPVSPWISCTVWRCHYQNVRVCIIRMTDIIMKCGSFSSFFFDLLVLFLRLSFDLKFLGGYHLSWHHRFNNDIVQSRLVSFVFVFTQWVNEFLDWWKCVVRAIH